MGLLSALALASFLVDGAATASEVVAADHIAPVTRAEQRAVVDALALALERDYLDPATGHRYAALLRDRLARGAYDGLVDPAAFSIALTADLQRLSPDAHLRVGLRNGFRQPRPARADMPSSVRPNGPPGLEQAAMVDGNVAYLRFNEFPDDPDSATKARAFLLAHTDADAIVIDCRPNRGGGMSVMNSLLPLFYGKATVQLRMDTRASAEADSPSEADPALIRRPSPAGLVRFDHVVVPDRSETRLRRVRIYYLTSRRTASAAEHMALALKRNRRAVLVGETTAGANHFGEEVSVDKRFVAFIPVGRSYDPNTGRDWERSGIRPDYPTRADDALATALRLAKTRNRNSLRHPIVRSSGKEASGS